MKQFFLLLFVTCSLAGYAQGPSTFGGIGLRVNDSTTYVTSAAAAHSAGYADIWYSNSSNLYWVWNGSQYVNWNPSSGTTASDSTFVDVKTFFPTSVTLATSTQQQRVDAWQAAIAAAQEGNYGIKFSGTWDLPTGALVVTEKLSILGVGYGSALTTTDNSGTLLLVNAPVPRVYYNVVFPEVKPFRAENFTVQYRGSSNPTSTSRGIKVAVDTSISFLHKFSKITIDSFYVGLEFHNVANAQVTGCYFRNNRAFGFLNTNNESLDYGKLMMHHNIFSTVATFPGEPDTTAHIKIEGGAGFDISYNDFYGNTDYAVWTYLKNTAEYFPALASSEYYFKNNKALFVQDYAFLFMSNYGTGGSGTSRVGNRIQNIQIQGNNTGFNGLVKTVGGTGSIFEVQISENFNESPLGTTSHNVFRNPISLAGAAMTNVTINDNYFVRSHLSTNSTSDKPIVVTGSISGYVNAFGNSYAGYTGVPDIQGFVSHNLGIGKVPAVPLDIVGIGQDTYARFSRLSNTSANGVVFTPAGTITGSNPQFFIGQPNNQSYLSLQRYDGSTTTSVLSIAAATNNVGIGVTAPTVNLDVSGTSNVYGRFTRPSNSNDNGIIFTPNGALSASNPQFFMGVSGGQSYYTFQRYDGTTATNLINIAAATNNVGIGSTLTAPTTQLHTTAFATAYVAKTGAYTLTGADYTVQVTSGTHTQTLPTAVGCTGRIYVITNSGSGTVTVGTTSSQTFVNITGTPTTLSLAQFKWVQVQSNGAAWLVISQN